MGLGGYMKSWQRQTKDFGHTQGDEYSVLLLDNRGIGDSDKPILRYTTSEMAADIVEVLDHLEWTAPRSLHVIGISMGGMIAQELGLQIPTRLCSLNLISTAPRIVRTLPFMENVRNRLNLMWPKPLDGQIAKVKADCYSAAWLAQPDETESVVQPFPTNGDRFAAGEVTKRMSPDAFRLSGFLCQLYAAGFHHKTAEQLAQLGDQVGRERIMVFHGDNDHMVDFVHGKMLLEELGGEARGVTKSFHTGIGHVAPFEIRKEFARIVAERVAATEALPK
nr:3-oxoadipate enol-lactonase 2 [Quercus suber]